MRVWITVIFAITLIAASSLIPWHADVQVRRAVGIVAATLILWITEVAPLGVVAIAIPIAAVLTGVLKWDDAVRAWGDKVIFLFLGSFLLARALEKHGVFDRLFDSDLVRGASSGPLRLAGIVLLLAGVVSAVQNNTAVTATLLPIVLPLARRMPAPFVPLLAISMGATFGGMCTPVGTAPNFLGYAEMKRLGSDLTFLGWLRVGAPVWLGTTLIGWLVLAVLTRMTSLPRTIVRATWLDRFLQTDVAVAPDRAAPTAPASKPRTSPAAQLWSLGALILAAILWLVSSLVQGSYPPKHPLRIGIETFLPESLVPIGIAWLLFVIRAGPNREPVLDRSDFQALDWDTLFLIAGGLTLGKLLETSGAAAALANSVAGVQLPGVLVMLALAGVTVLLSELTSNTATAGLMIPIGASLAPALKLSPPQVVMLIALSASLGFALPVSTPPNALVYGTRLIPLRVMFATGIIVDVLATLWVTACVWYLG